VQAAAFPDFPDPQEPQERTVAPEDPEYPVPQVSPDAHQQSAKNPHHHLAGPAHLDHLDLRDHPAELELPAAQDPLVAMETTEPPASPDLRDHPAPQETLAPTVNPETPEPQLSPSPSSPETQDHREMLDHKVFPETQEHPVPMDNLEAPDPRDHLAHPAHRDLQETTDNPDLVDHPDLREKGACARNTALWTAVSFSKMERGDKRSAGQISVCLFQFFLVFSSISCHHSLSRVSDSPKR
jgi:hypothetical protein